MGCKDIQNHRLKLQLTVATDFAIHHKLRRAVDVKLWNKVMDSINRRSRLDTVKKEVVEVVIQGLGGWREKDL